MEHYVTLFDSIFLPQGLALHMSMERHVKVYTLWILCVDDEVHNVLTKLQLPNVCLLQLSKLETEELLYVKPTRSKVEYCWTLTPFAPRFVFEANSEVRRVTYLDADLWFLKHPKSIFKEFHASGKQVLITDHGYASEYDQSAKSGQYCVQFMIFNRIGGERVRKWWEDRCIEWCFARMENNRFGDQKYLDVWPTLFNDIVHVLEKKQYALAPWNAIIYKPQDAVFYHFHGLRITKNGVLTSLGYKIPKMTKDIIYAEYIKNIEELLKIIKIKGISRERIIQEKSPGLKKMKYAIKFMFKKFFA